MIHDPVSTYQRIRDIANNISYGDITNALGLKLKGGIDDLATYDEVIDFREDLAVCLDKAFLELERSMPGIARSVVVTSVSSDFDQNFSYAKPNTQFKGGMEISVEEHVDGLYFDITIYRFVGRTGRVNATEKDLRHLNKLQVNQETFPLNSVDGLSVDRSGEQDLVPIGQLSNELKEKGMKLGATDAFMVRYRAVIPDNKMPELYVQHGPNSAH